MTWKLAAPLLGLLVLAACDKTEPQTDTAPSAEPKPEPVASAPEPAASTPEPTASAEPTPKDSAAPEAKSAEPATTAKPAATAKAAAATTTAAPTAKAAPTASAEPERKVKTAGGTSASSDSFAVSISAPSPVRAGQSANASIVLSAKAPYHCNPKYPYKFAVDGGSTVRGMSVSEKSASMAVPFTPAQKGKTTVSGTLSFSVCTADKCLIEKRKLSVSVDAD